MSLPAFEALVRALRDPTRPDVNYDLVVGEIVRAFTRGLVPFLELSSKFVDADWRVLCGVTDATTLWMEDGQSHAAEADDPRFMPRYVMAFHVFSVLWPAVIRGAERHDEDLHHFLHVISEVTSLPIKSICVAVLEQAKVASDDQLAIAFDMVADTASERPSLRDRELTELKSAVETILRERTDLQNVERLVGLLRRWRVDGLE